MSIINVFFVNHPVAGISNPYTSVDMRRFDTAWWPAGSSAVGELLASDIDMDWPIDANGHPLNGRLASSYSDDFYHRIHITPSALDLGNIISTQTQAVNIWNAYLTPQQLTSIEGEQEGIELTGQPTPPLTFTALQEREWTVAITPDGPAVLDTQLQWVFSNGDTADLAITGNRITAFTWAPDWANGIRERLIWATDIMQSPRGAEQRRAIRLAPRRELNADLIVDGRERQAFDMAMFGWGARIWAVPIWPEIQLLSSGVDAGALEIPCDTSHLDFRDNGLALLRGETSFHYETVEIQSIAADALTLKRPLQMSWPAGTRLYPARTARLSQVPELARKTDMMQTASVNFEVMEPSDWPAVMPATTYRSFPVYDAVPEESQDLTSSFANLTLLLDNGSAIPRLQDTSGKAMPVLLHRWQLYGRAERAAFRSFLYALDGRRVPVWIPTHADDLTLVATITSNAAVMDIAAIGYTRFAQTKVGRWDIRIWLRDGSVFYRRITAAAEISTEVERLVIDSSFGITITPDDVMRISFLQLVRSDSDSVEIEHVTDSEGVARAQQIFKGVRDDDI